MNPFFESQSMTGSTVSVGMQTREFNFGSTISYGYGPATTDTILQWFGQEGNNAADFAQAFSAELAANAQWIRNSMS